MATREELKLFKDGARPLRLFLYPAPIGCLAFLLSATALLVYLVAADVLIPVVLGLLLFMIAVALGGLVIYAHVWPCCYCCGTRAPYVVKLYAWLDRAQTLVTGGDGDADKDMDADVPKGQNPFSV